MSLADVPYMLRNLYIGDDEQTRIEDPKYWEDMPDKMKPVMQGLVGEGFYDEAIIIFAKYWFHTCTEDEWKETVDEVWEEIEKDWHEFTDDPPGVHTYGNNEDSCLGISKKQLINWYSPIIRGCYELPKE